MDRSLNVAKPFLAVSVIVPLILPPAGEPVASAMFIVSVLSLVSTLPNLSSIATVTVGLMVTPATVFVGCVWKASCDAAAGVMLKALDVAWVKAVLVELLATSV